MSASYDLVCLSHLRWDFVYQRPQHLLSRFARTHRVFFVEEPIYEPRADAYLDVSQRADGVWVATPYLPTGVSLLRATAHQMLLVDQLLQAEQVDRYVLWYYTPMARDYSSHLTPLATVYDCMDELSAFHGAPPAMVQREQDLLANADVVFTGGASLYEAKRHQHPRVYAMPSSVDAAHFARARHPQAAVPAQVDLPTPRIGFYGVLDERFDRDLLAAVADARPEWSFVLVGPVVKIAPADLPQRPNVHYLGQQPYSALPDFLAGWDVAMMPFARNEATRFISPTKTLEYLAGGKPVVSTSITDVVHPYGDAGLVTIADAPADFIAAIEGALAQDRALWLTQVDAFLATHSWDRTWARMDRLLNEVIDQLVVLPKEAIAPRHSRTSAEYPAFAPLGADFAPEITAMEE